LHARVSYVKDLAAGARVSYGLRYELPRASRIATVPVGYADGVPRALGAVGGEVLVRGVRCLIAGTVTMDQLLVDVGDLDVAVDDDVVLLGRQGDDEITADEWAARLDTIAYEVVTRLGGRLPRRYSS
jgi:alanine racemase